MPAPISWDNYERIGILSATTGLIFSLIYCVTRWQLGVSIQLVAFTLGVLFFLVFGSAALIRSLVLQLEVEPTFVLSALALGLVVIAGLGILFGDFGWLIGLTIAFIGYLLAVQTLCKHLHLIKLKKVQAIALMWLGLNLFIAFRIWGVQYLSPLFDVNVATIAAHPDTLFHIAITNMIRTYGLPSTGVDGLVFLPYHFGSHLLFAGLANIVGVTSLDFLMLGYPVIFLPLLQLVCLLVIMMLRQLYLGQIVEFDQLHFWLMYAVGWIGWLPLMLQNRTQTDSIIFMSESYTVGLFFFLIWLSWILKLHTGRLIIRQGFSLAVVLLMIGVIKLSFLYLGLSLTIFGLLKKRYFLKPQWLLLSAVTLIASWFLITQLTLSEHRLQFEVGSFFSSWLNEPWRIGWLVEMFGWLALGLWLIHRKNALALHQQLIVLTIAGLLPVICFKMPGGNEQYFIEVQRWGAWLAVVAFLPQSWAHYKWLRLGLCTILILNLFLAGRIYYSLHHQRLTRLTEMYGVRAATQPSVIKSLTDLSSLPTRYRQLYYLQIPNDSAYWQLHNTCQARPLLAPALSGVALINGLQDESCDRNLYGHQVYLNSFDHSKMSKSLLTIYE